MEIEGLEGLSGTDIIQETFLFKFLNFDETLELSRLFSKEKRKNGAVIIEEGALGQALYLIEKGKVKVYKDEDGSPEELATLGRGELFGEMSLIEDELTSASVVASGEVELLVITRENLRALMDGNMEIAFKIYKTFCHTLSERLRRTSEELSRLKKSKPQKSGGAGKAPAEKAKPKKKPAAQKAAKKKSAKKKTGKK